MKNEPLRLALSTGAIASLLITLCAPGCGSSESHKVKGQPDASLGEAGEGGSAAGGSTARGGSGGSGARAGAAGNASSIGGTGGAAGEGAAGSSTPLGEGGAIESWAGAGGESGDDTPEIDAGTGCLAPANGTRLNPASAGLPANGLALWLRADRGVYMTAANRVCAWADQSGHDAVFFPAADTTRPLWVGTGIGTAPAVHFDADGRDMTIGGVLGIPAQSGRTLVTVLKLGNTTSRCQALQQAQSGSAGTYIQTDANTFQTVGSREGVYMMNNAYDAALATSTDARIHVYTVNTMTVGTAIAGAIDYRVNGATQALTRTPGGMGTGNFEDFSGANYTGIGACPDAFLAEALIYDRALTVPERAAVEAALEARYGIVP